jgi:hypothetical protein
MRKNSFYYVSRRSVKKYSQTAVNKKRKLALSAAPKHLKLHDFLSKRKDKSKTAPQVNLKVGKTVSVLLIFMKVLQNVVFRKLSWHTFILLF